MSCVRIQLWMAVFAFVFVGNLNGDDLHCSSDSLISNGKFEVCWRKQTATASPNHLLIHFHGDPTTVKKAFSRDGIDAVLVIVNFPGLSSSYSKPFEMDADLFQEILQRANRAIGGTVISEADRKWQRITLSSFSAGYGAIREILKTPENFDQIDTIITADSIYAGLQEGAPERQVNLQDMKDFLSFASLSTQGLKSFLISHSEQPTPYASTTETADYLLRSLRMSRHLESSIRTQSLRQISEASRGKFQVLGFQGTSGDDHMQHLHHIHLLWKQSRSKTQLSQ